MILQFPTPYPDELLYSVIARYHVRSGNFFWKHTLEDLFGRKTASATAFLPSGIRSLVQHLPPNTTLTEQTLLEKHTMYPFYTVFLPTEKAQSIYDSMLKDDGRTIYMQSGITASSIPQNQYFKYCPTCAKEDINRYGEMYWHRIHQFPGNLICREHDLWMEDNSTVAIIHSNKHAFILPTKCNCDLKRERPVEKNILHEFKNFILQSGRLLEGKYEQRTFSYYTAFYRDFLIEKGFASYSGQVNQKELLDAYHAFYSNELLEGLHAEVGAKEPWLVAFTRKHRKSFHPYYHILMRPVSIGVNLNTESIFNPSKLTMFEYNLSRL